MGGDVEGSEEAEASHWRRRLSCASGGGSGGDVIERQLDRRRDEGRILCRACDNVKEQSEPERASEVVGRVSKSAVESVVVLERVYGGCERPSSGDVCDACVQS